MKAKDVRARAAAAEALAAFHRWRLETQPCKDRQAFVRQDGGCLRCDADAGEICRERRR